MNKLWISNVPPEASDEEISALVTKYAPGLYCFKVQRVEGTGSQPGVLLSLAHEKPESISAASTSDGAQSVAAMLGALENLARALNGMYWKGRTLSSSTMIFDAKR